jgi:hypothetical protein
MADILHSVTHHLQSLFSGTANLLARRTGFTQRRSKLTGSVFAQTLVFGWLQNPQATLEELAQVAASFDVSITAQGLEQRFGPEAAAFLEQLLHEAVSRVVHADPAVIPLLQRFTGVFALDSTVIRLPSALAGRWPGLGSNSRKSRKRGLKSKPTTSSVAALKAQVCLNLLDGNLSGPFLSAATMADQKGVVQQASLPAGALRLADLGFFSLEKVQQLQTQKVWFLSRVQLGTCWRDSQERVWTTAAFLATQNEARVDVPIQLGLDQRVPCRLLAWRVPPTVAAKRRRQWRQQARKRGARLHPDRLILADWTFYVTNIPKELLSPEEAWVLYRCRWQIELLFKLWKSYGRVDESRSDKPWRVLCEVYAKLLSMIVQHWLLLVSCWSRPERSLMKASAAVRQHALALALVLEHGHLVLGILRQLQKCLSHGRCINHQKRNPPTHQLLLRLAPVA